MKTAEAHSFQVFDLAQKLVFFQLCVPTPKGRPTIFRRGIFEKRMGKSAVAVFLV
jgi:hypothetical protein